MKKIIYILVTALAMMSVSCTSYISIKSLKPAKYHLGSQPEIAVVKADGDRRNTQDIVIEQLIAQSGKTPYLNVTSRAGEGIYFNIEDGLPVSKGKTVEMGESKRFIEFRIIDSDVDRLNEVRTRTKKVKDKDGKSKTVKENYNAQVMKSDVVIAFTIIGSGKVYMRDKEYEGTARQDAKGSGPDKEAMTELAVKNCIEKLMKDITPVLVTYNVRMDESDDGQAPMIEDAKAGRIAIARKQFLEYAETHPDLPSVWYNTAVMTDAEGDYEKAIEYYNKAIVLGGEDYYHKALSSCMQRLEQQNVMD